MKKLILFIIASLLLISSGYADFMSSRPRPDVELRGTPKLVDGFEAGTPISRANVPYPISIIRKDSNGVGVAGIFGEASDLTDQSQDTYIVYYMMKAGVPTYINSIFQIESLGAGTGQTVIVNGTSELTSDDDSTDEEGTLGSGDFPGQIKTLRLVTDGGDDWDLTITNHETSDPEVATFDAADEYLVLLWSGTEWVTISNTCTFP